MFVFDLAVCLLECLRKLVCDATIPLSRLCICIFFYCLFNLFSDISCFVAFQADLFSHLFMLVHWFQTQIIWLFNISILSVHDESYSRNASCAVNLISTFLLQNMIHERMNPQWQNKISNVYAL